MYPTINTALAAEHRHDMVAQAERATLARATRHRAAAGSRGPRRAAGRAHLPGALVPGYRVSWSRTTLAPAAGSRRGRSWIIVISATRGL